MEDRDKDMEAKEKAVLEKTLAKLKLEMSPEELAKFEAGEFALVPSPQEVELQKLEKKLSNQAKREAEDLQAVQDRVDKLKSELSNYQGESLLQKQAQVANVEKILVLVQAKVAQGQADREQALLEKKHGPFMESQVETAPLENVGEYSPGTSANFAVIKLAGTQFKVTKNDLLHVTRIPYVEVGQKLLIDAVLLAGNKTHTYVGSPLVPNTLVHCTVEEHTKDKKILTFKRRRRKHSQTLRGSRRQITVLRVNNVFLPGEVPSGLEATSVPVKPAKKERKPRFKSDSWVWFNLMREYKKTLATPVVNKFALWAANDRVVQAEEKMRMLGLEELALKELSAESVLFSASQMDAEMNTSQEDLDLLASLGFDEVEKK